jgi:hypothetical protein
VLTTVDGSESATVAIYGIARFNTEEGTGRGIVIALVHTSSTGRLAPLDGMILAGHVQFHPYESSSMTYWEWQSGVPLPSMGTTAEEPPLMNTTTTTTNATATDTDATTATGEEQQ